MNTISLHHHKHLTLISPSQPHHNHNNKLPPNRIQMSTTTSTTTASASDPNYDRLKELKEFDESKIGVKGLLDQNLTTIPRFFIHPTPAPASAPSSAPSPAPPSIPTIDFSSPLPILTTQLKNSASSFGFFQVTNHKIPPQTITNLLTSLTTFNELPSSEKSKFYTRDMSHGAAFSTNFDLYQSKAASWRDTLQLRLGPTPPDWDFVPEQCREAIREWDKEAVKFAEELMGILCQGLGLEGNVLKEMGCLDMRVMAAHYYPYCPQAELTNGLSSHTDPGLVTVLVQNEVVGLQVKVGEQWVDVVPVEGAIVINIGDILQIMSNDEYRSVEHRVVANSFKEPRISAAIFFNPGNREKMFGPLDGLISPEKPAKYRQFALNDYMKRFFTKELDGKSLTNYYSVSNAEQGI